MYVNVIVVKTYGAFFLFLMEKLNCFLLLLRLQMLTMLRFAAHIVVGVMMGLLYWQVGNDAAAVYNNAGLLFFNLLFILFGAMMPTVVTC